jgi:hypothetical protein
MKCTRLAVAVLFLFSALAARGDNWTQWVPFGNSISIRFLQVNRDTCTWQFRNDTNRTLTTLNFNIDNTDADTGAQDHSTDLLPYPLKPGQAIGGWAVFSANANCSTVRITATSIQWN